MKAACVWNAGSAQDFLFDNGLVTLVRAKFDVAGELVAWSGADVQAELVDERTLRVTDKHTGQPVLTDHSTATVTPYGAPEGAPPIAQLTPYEQGGKLWGWSYVAKSRRRSRFNGAAVSRPRRHL